MGRSWWSLGWNSRNTVLMGWTKGVVIFGKIHPGKRSDMTGHDKKMCSTEEQCWNLLERTAQHYLCSFGFDRDGCLQICHLAKTNTAGKSSCPWDFFWFFTVKVSKKNRLVVFRRAAAMFHEDPWRISLEDLHVTRGSDTHSGIF